MAELVSVQRLTKRRVIAAVAVLIILGASVWAAYTRPDLEGLAVYGYPGLFLLMFISSGSIILPVPGFATVIAAGTVGNPLLIALFAGPGSALGELTGYMAGCGGRTIIGEWRLGVLQRVEGWLRRYGFWALLVLAAVPNPAFDVVGLAAGSLNYPVRKFLLACLIGNTIKYLLLAYLGYAAIGLFTWS